MGSRAGVDRTDLAPAGTDRTDIEQAVLTVLRRIVGNDAIAPSDNFFLIGGHSLLIVKIVRQLRTEYGLDLDARQFASNPQVASLISACRPIPPS